MVSQPLLAGGEGLGLGDEKGADGFAGSQAQDGIGFPAIGNDGVGAAACSALGGDDLGDHAAGANGAAGTAGHGFE